MLLCNSFLLGQKTSNDDGFYMRWHASLMNIKDLNGKAMKIDSFMLYS
jgi:hypothetical protein